MTHKVPIGSCWLRVRFNSFIQFHTVSQAGVLQTKSPLKSKQPLTWTVLSCLYVRDDVVLSGATGGLSWFLDVARNVHRQGKMVERQFSHEGNVKVRGIAKQVMFWVQQSANFIWIDGRYTIRISFLGGQGTQGHHVICVKLQHTWQSRSLVNATDGSTWRNSGVHSDHTS